MTFSLYHASIPVFQRQLNGLSDILDKAVIYCTDRKIDQVALLHDRLYPDMFPLQMQVQQACTHALRGSFRIAGAEAPAMENTEASFADLKARIAKVLELIKTLKPETVDAMAGKEITFPAGQRQMTLTADDYLLHSAMPNFYFHVTTAYNILRHNGLEIGKRDFMGTR